MRAQCLMGHQSSLEPASEKGLSLDPPPFTLPVQKPGPSRA